MTSQTVTVQIEAMEPAALFPMEPGHRPVWPAGVFIRYDGRAVHGDLISITGPRDAVESFLAEHWGYETAEDMEYFIVDRGVN